VRVYIPEGGQAAEEGNEGQEGDGHRDDDEVAGKGHVRTPRTYFVPCTHVYWYGWDAPLQPHGDDGGAIAQSSGRQTADSRGPPK
jgi:hypothetical protein